MFGFGKENEYESIFESEDSIYSHIYRDRSKTAEVLGDQKFINAWLNSSSQPRVSSIIAREAEKGDIPSIKQMVWFYQVMLQNMQANGREAPIDIQINFLEGCLHFCTVGERFGMNYTYHMMFAHVNLYQIYMSNNGLADGAEIPKTLKAAVSCAKKMLEEEHLAGDIYDDPQGALQDARDIVGSYGHLAEAYDLFPN